jgi:hypothetical protein
MANQLIVLSNKENLLENNIKLPVVFQGMEVKELTPINDDFKPNQINSNAHQTARYSIRPYYKPLLIIP